MAYLGRGQPFPPLIRRFVVPAAAPPGGAGTPLRTLLGVGLSLMCLLG